MSAPAAMGTDYIDDYSTCARTFVTLRLYSVQVSPEDISAVLRVPPTRAVRKDELQGATQARNKFHAWFLSSEPHLTSKDARRHLDWLYTQLRPAIADLQGLRARGVHGDVACYWQSVSGRGGPTLSGDQFSRLSELGLDVWFDVQLP